MARFRRSLQIPGSVDTNKIEANFKSGVLTVILPKSADAEKKQKNNSGKREISNP